LEEMERKAPMIQRLKDDTQPKKGQEKAN